MCLRRNLSRSAAAATKRLVDTTTGKTTCTVTYAGTGSHSITAAYSGNGNFSGSTSDPANTDGRQGLDDDVNVVVGEPLGGRAAAHLHRDGGPVPAWWHGDVLRRNLSDQRLQRQARWTPPQAKRPARSPTALAQGPTRSPPPTPATATPPAAPSHPANTDGRQGPDDDVNVVVGEPLGGRAAAHLHRDGGPGPRRWDGEMFS